MKFLGNFSGWAVVYGSFAKNNPWLGMLRQTLQLVVVVTGMAFALASHAQESDWKVDGDARRDAKVVARYRQLLLRNPDQPLIYRSLIGKLGRGPALDPFIDDVRAVATSSTRAAPWILLGHLERDRGRDTVSRTAYEHAVAIESDSAAAHSALAAAQDRSGQAKAADASYERALALTSTTTARKALLRKLADLATSRSDHGRAVQWMEALAQASGRDFNLRVELAETQLRAHRFDAALQTYDVALKLAHRDGKRRARVLIDVGNLHRRMHNPVAAERAYRDALAVVGKSSWMRREVLMRLVDTARDLHRVREIVVELEREWRNPSYHDAMVLAGLAEELGSDPDAVKWLERAARLDARAIEPRTRLIARLDHVRDATRVSALYDEIVALRRGNLTPRLERIEWLFFRGERAEQALAELRSVEQEVASDPESLVEVAAQWQQFGMSDAALRVHARLEGSHPDNVTHLEAYGELLSRVGQPAAADAIWARLFALDEADLRVRLRVAEIAARLQDYRRTCELLTWVLERAPRLVQARERLAGAFEAREMWVDALREWETLFFEDRVSHAGRRIVNIAQRTAFLGDIIVSPDPEMMRRWEAKFAATGSPRVGVVLAKLRAAHGDHAGALALAATLADVDPATLPAGQHLAWVDAAEFVVNETRSTDPTSAIAMLERIAAAFGDRRVPAWRRAVDLALLLNDPGGQEAVIRRAVTTVPNDAYVHAVAGIYWSERDVDLAIKHLQRAVALGTTSYDVHFDLAFHLSLTGRDDEARGVFLDVIRSDGGGSWAASAVFAAIDLCRTDAQLFEIERELGSLLGRLPESVLHAITVAIYQELFMYAEDAAAAFATAAERALPRLVRAVGAEELGDQMRAMSLLRLYPAPDVARHALRAWPTDSRQWSTTMVLALAQTGDARASVALVNALQSSDDDLRQVAIFAIGMARVSEATETLVNIAFAEGFSDDVRSLAIAGLGRIGSTAAVQSLERLDHAGSPERRVLIAWALGQGRSAAAAAALSRRLDDAAPDVRRVAGVMLSGFGSDVGLRSLLEAAWAPDSSRRAMAEYGLKAAVNEPLLWEVDGQASARPRLAAAIGQALATRADQPVARAFVGREQVVVATAQELLRGSNPRVLEHLVLAAEELDHTTEHDLASSLRQIVTGLRPNLRRLTASSDTRSVMSAALLLPLARRAEDAPLVAHAAGSLAEPYGSRVVERLAVYPWSIVRPTLLAGISSGAPTRRAASLRVLARTRRPEVDADSLELIVAIARNERGPLQDAAIEALGALRHEASAELLAELFDRSPPDTQTRIRTSLGQMTSPAAREAARNLAIRPTKPVCAGDPEDLADLLNDACVGAVDILDF